MSLLSVLPIQSKDEQAAACAVCGVEFDTDLLAYKITDGDKLVGVSQFKMTPEGGKIVNISCVKGTDCFEYMLMLGRGTLNFIDICGARYAFLDDPTVDDVMSKAIGFAKDENGRYKVDLLHFFDEPCKHNCGK
jgi:hypothetical protein